MEQAEFDIEGMTCAACANRIEKKSTGWMVLIKDQ